MYDVNLSKTVKLLAAVLQGPYAFSVRLHRHDSNFVDYQRS